MLNEKNSSLHKKDYFIGLDIGTDSVGYAVTDEDYILRRCKGEPMWGVCLFDKAKLCNERRGFRTSRRRLERKKCVFSWCVSFLQVRSPKRIRTFIKSSMKAHYGRKIKLFQRMT